MKSTFLLEGLGCANCAMKMQTQIEKIDGVSNVTINFMTTKLVLEAQDNKMDKIIETAKKIIKRIESDVVMRKI